MDQELVYRQEQADAEALDKKGQGIKLTELGLSYFEEKKLVEERREILRQRRIEGIKEEIQQFKEVKTLMLQALDREKKQDEYKRQVEISKFKEVKELIKGEQKIELEWNLGVFKQLNNEEKELRQELLSKQHEVH